MIAVLRINSDSEASVESAFERLAEALGERVVINPRDPSMRSVSISSSDRVRDVMEDVDRFPGRMVSSLGQEDIQLIRGASLDIGVGPEDAGDSVYVEVILSDVTMASLSALGVGFIVTIYGLWVDSPRTE